jgi:hypothetical protein
LDKKDITGLSKVIENSIVFTLSKQGRFSKFKSSDQEKNVALRKRKIMIGMAQDTYAHEYNMNQSDIVDSSDEETGNYFKRNEEKMRKAQAPKL